MRIFKNLSSFMRIKTATVIINRWKTLIIKCIFKEIFNKLLSHIRIKNANCESCYWRTLISKINLRKFSKIYLYTSELKLRL